MNTDPPLPPSPPLGPPRGTNFSRRNARQPLPPPPATTWMSTSSTNIRTICPYPISSSLFEWQNADDAAACAVILEADASGDLREDRVVFAKSRVAAGTEPPAPLAHDD